MPHPNKPPAEKSFSILKIFNYAGAALIFLGITIFIGLNWFSLNSFIRVFVTLGGAIAAFVLGILLHVDKRHEAAGSAFFMIAGLLFPIGLYVMLDTLGIKWTSDKLDLFISGVCFCIFLFAHLYFRRTILLLFTIIFASLVFLSLIDFITATTGIVFQHLFEYEMIILGISYILFGRYLYFAKTYPLTGLLYFFGALMVLSASFCLSQPFYKYGGDAMWRIITALLIILTFVLSVPMRTKSFLYLGSLFLILYICDMSYRFANLFGNMGWPLVLILAGFLLMFLGYFVIYLRKKIGRA